MQGFVFNMRRPLFQDPRVRQALAYAFDFEWIEQESVLRRLHADRSYFVNSELAATGPAAGRRAGDPREVHAARSPTRSSPPNTSRRSTDGSGNIRDDLREALRLLKEAGWTRQGRQARQRRDRSALRVRDPARADPQFERDRPALRARISSGWASQRVCARSTPAQYEKRMQTLRLRHGGRRLRRIAVAGQRAARLSGARQSADEPGSRNYIGIKDKAIDELVEQGRSTRPTARAWWPARHALDRVLLYGYYVIPNWHIGDFRVAYWDKFGRPHGLAAIRPRPRHLVDRPGQGRADGRERRSAAARLRHDGVSGPRPMIAYIAPPHPADHPDAVRASWWSISSSCRPRPAGRSSR